MVRLFQVYYPVRAIVLIVGEALIICASFLVATLLIFGQDSVLVLNYENGFYQIMALTTIAVVCGYFFDLYATQRLGVKGELYARLLLALGVLSFLLAGLQYALPRYMPANGVLLLGFLILTFAILAWRWGFGWLVQQPYLKQRLYVLGSGDLSKELVHGIRSRPDLGMEIVDWAGATGNCSREELERNLQALQNSRHVDQVVVALEDRRGTMPVRELLNLRLSGVKIEDAGALLEKISGKIELDGLHPSTLIFTEGFRLNQGLLLARRAASIVVSLVILLFCLPLIPFIALAIKVSSPGPVLFPQERVGRNGLPFNLYKFRTMCQNAELETGPTWATEDDPRVTRVGRWLRRTRLDEIPQLYNVLKGDMGFVGPRPERPEFVQWLIEVIPYYQMRHIIRPGITGWAQVRYQYGSSLEETKQKLKYDLYYIKHMSLALDCLIVFETVKTILLARGSR